MQQQRTLPARTRQRRDALLDELVELFLAEGFAGFGIGELAQRLSCSRSTLYLVAPSKEQLITATVRRFFKRAAERIEDRVEAAADPADRLSTYLTAVADELAPASPRFYADLAGFPPGAEVYRANTAQAAARVQALVTEGVAAGTLRKVNATFVGAAVAEVMDAIGDGRIGTATGLDDAQAYQALVDLVATGLRARG
ncbi:TetR/AcrR family transcriptional regulator [Nocardioides daeguensis]|uniref:TetR/AcrR family transcriptional regulator n=1 Tax=Nocardioides daeguensis TaxID=908359 RepID=A0ABP6V0A4_9ACTN|nr:TetR/AcrR family transcriptional regulator [Nocardioides daeguensis]